MVHIVVLNKLTLLRDVPKLIYVFTFKVHDNVLHIDGSYRVGPKVELLMAILLLTFSTNLASSHLKSQA